MIRYEAPPALNASRETRLAFVFENATKLLVWKLRDLLISMAKKVLI